MHNSGPRPQGPGSGRSPWGKHVSVQAAQAPRPSAQNTTGEHATRTAQSPPWPPCAAQPTPNTTVPRQPHQNERKGRKASEEGGAKLQTRLGRLAFSERPARRDPARETILTPQKRSSPRAVRRIVPQKKKQRVPKNRWRVAGPAHTATHPKKRKPCTCSQ